jgi:hypothetical protein
MMGLFWEGFLVVHIWCVVRAALVDIWERFIVPALSCNSRFLNCYILCFWLRLWDVIMVVVTDSVWDRCLSPVVRSRRRLEQLLVTKNQFHLNASCMKTCMFSFLTGSYVHVLTWLVCPLQYFPRGYLVRTTVVFCWVYMLLRWRMVRHWQWPGPNLTMSCQAQAVKRQGPR